MNTCKVLLVDDSMIIRKMLSRALKDEPGIELVDSLSDGQQALNFLALHKDVDVVILNIDMPVINGLQALPGILKSVPYIQVLMCSTLTVHNADITIQALRLGAADYITKPSVRSGNGLDSSKTFKKDLIERLHMLGLVAAHKRKGILDVVPPVHEHCTHTRCSSSESIVTTLSKKYKQQTLTVRPFPMFFGKPHAICIGSSTGGPKALVQLIKDIGLLDQPIFITQHMLPNFTAMLAEHISKASGLVALEAIDGMIVECGKVYIAPGNYHMLIKNHNGHQVIHLSQSPPENFCRPAVDPMLRSAVEVYKNRLLVVILTGIGLDGFNGSKMVVEAGGCVIAQDAASSVVWGMPGAVATAGLCVAILGLEDLGGAVRQIAMGKGLCNK